MIRRRTRRACGERGVVLTELAVSLPIFALLLTFLAFALVWGWRSYQRTVADAELRQEMQYELIRLKNELGITFIYVTHDQEEALTMSDYVVVMNQGYIQQAGTPEQIYNEPENAFVADFIGDSNIVPGLMLEDRLVRIFGANFPCIDEGFGKNKPVDVVIRPEDVEILDENDDRAILHGTMTHIIFKGEIYEMECTTANGFEWLVHSTEMHEPGKKVGLYVRPSNIQIMNKPESEDEEAIGVEE